MSAALDNPRRCVLFVPGSRPERYLKALSCDADQVCIDLEDAVGPADKVGAREAALRFLNEQPESRSEVGLRINPIDTELGENDLTALAEAPRMPDFLMLPKVESPEVLISLIARLSERCPPLVALIESPAGLAKADAIAHCQSMQALMFGGYDFASALRGRPGWDSFFLPRAQLALAAARSGIGFIDVPFLSINDPTALTEETARVIAMGATARAAIHPAQVEIIQQCFLPSEAETSAARRVTQAMADAGGAAVQVDGKLVDRPIELAAQRCLQLARFGTRSDTRPAS